MPPASGRGDARVEAGLRTASAWLVRGEWARAERVLSALMDIRVDDVRVLAMLAMVKAADVERLDPERLAHARVLARLAEQIGAPSAGAGELAREASRSVDRAEASLGRGGHGRGWKP